MDRLDGRLDGGRPVGDTRIEAGAIAPVNLNTNDGARRLNGAANRHPTMNDKEETR